MTVCAGAAATGRAPGVRLSVVAGVIAGAGRAGADDGAAAGPPEVQAARTTPRTATAATIRKLMRRTVAAAAIRAAADRQVPARSPRPDPGMPQAETRNLGRTPREGSAAPSDQELWLTRQDGCWACRACRDRLAHHWCAVPR